MTVFPDQLEYLRTALAASGLRLREGATRARS